MLERPLIYLVPVLAGTLFCAVYLDIAISFSLTLLLLSVFLFLSGILIYHKRLFTICAMLATINFAFSLFSLYNLFIVNPIRELNGQRMDVEVILLQDATIYDDTQRALLSVTDIAQLDRNFRIYCYLPLTDTPLIAGDRIKVNIEFYLPNTAEGFDRATYQAANQCFISGSYTKDDENNPRLFKYLSSNSSHIRFLPQRIARYCKQSISDYFPSRSAGLLTALLLGDKSGISDADMLSMRIAGLSHLIAVSGLHIGFLVAFCSLLGRKIGIYISIPLILLFVPVAGATPSVIRAAVMYLITAAAFLLRKETNSLNSLFFALALLLCINPYAIASLSLQLSFLATFGLITLAGNIQHRLMQPFTTSSKLSRRLLSIVTGSISCTVCATVFTTPVVLHSFGYVSILSIISNFLIVGVSSVCFIGGFLLCCAAIPFPAFCTLCAKIIDPLLNYIMAVCKWIAGLPFGRISWTDGFGTASLIICFAGILLWLLAGKHIKWRYLLPAMSVLLIGISAYGIYYNQQRYTVTYLPCGSGQAILVSDTNQHLMLIDCAGDGGYRNASDEVQEWMQWNGFDRIDTLVLTAVDKSHARDLPDLLQNVAVDRIFIPNGCKLTKHNQEFLQLLQQSKAKIVDEPMSLTSAATSIDLFPICNGKLGVQIGNRVLVLHSPTQKQLAEYYESAVHTAPTIVISQRNTEDILLLSDLLLDTQAKRIILQTGIGDALRKFHDIPIESPYFTGIIQEKYKKEV